MAQKPKTAPSAEAAPKAPRQPLPIVPLLQTLAVLGAMGLLYYSKILYKKPSITEDGERERLAALRAKPAVPAVSGLVDFEPITVNIMATPDHPAPADGTSQQLQGKLHYATIGFSMEVRDKNQQDLIDAIRPLILDKLILILGKKQFHELTTVQGRYTLHSQILEVANQLALKLAISPAQENLVSNIFFTQFIVQ